MDGALLAGLLAGYGIALPVGAIGSYLVSLTARTSLRLGASAALGVATADGLYALAAAAGGSALAGVITPVAGPLRWASAVVLVTLAVVGAAGALRKHREGRPPGEARGGATTPARAFAGLLGLTLLNPATVVYFAALVAGDHATVAAGPATAAVFVAAAFAASASWQLLLVCGGAALGRVLTGRRGRLVTALVSSAVIAALAVHLVSAQERSNDTTHSRAEARRTQVGPVLLDVGQAGVPRVLAEDHPPACRDVRERGPQRVLLLVVDEHAEAAVRVVERVGHVSLLVTSTSSTRSRSTSCSAADRSRTPVS